ncbi:hypothetical protein IPJ70_01870 [Candidatus Campbellbacteria bacterium]|nr:MAG: hypothetical protein IPJ70_01870 [Candidatus Campbellbacteria bacterium]
MALPNSFTKLYLDFIQKLQTLTLGISIAVLLTLPILLSFFPSLVPKTAWGMLYATSLACVFFVMVIRPLADIFSNTPWIRALVILRKGLGVLSASIIVSFAFSKIILTGTDYFTAMFTPAYWSLANYGLFAHLGDWAAIPLLITSNKFSKRVLGVWWKRIQKLAYVYFYAGALYELLALQSTFAFVALIIVTLLVLIAFVKNQFKDKQPTTSIPQPPQQSPQPLTQSL